VPDPRSAFGLPDTRGAIDLSQFGPGGQRAASDDVTKTMDVHDTEIDAIQRVLETLRNRSASQRNYDDFQREIIDRFAQIGFVVDVRWYETTQKGVLIPEINISGRTESGFVFDRDRQTHEVTNDVLGLGDKGVIKVDRDTMKALESGSYKGGGGHQH
jgi:hypothetical protein